MSSPLPQICQYRLRKDGIHEFTFTKSGRQGIDQWFQIANQIYASVTQESRLKFLVDLRQSGAMPLPYLFQRGRVWLASLKIHPRVKMAVMYHDDVLLTLSNTFLKNLRLGHLQLNWYRNDQYEAACQWLNTAFTTKRLEAEKR